MRPFKSLFVLKQLSKHCKLFPRLLEHYIIRNNRFFFRISGATVCLDNLSFVLCTSFIIKIGKRIGVSKDFDQKIKLHKGTADIIIFSFNWSIGNIFCNQIMARNT